MTSPETPASFDYGFDIVHCTDQDFQVHLIRHAAFRQTITSPELLNIHDEYFLVLGEEARKRADRLEKVNKELETFWSQRSIGPYLISIIMGILLLALWFSR